MYIGLIPRAKKKIPDIFDQLLVKTMFKKHIIYPMNEAGITNQWLDFKTMQERVDSMDTMPGSKTFIERMKELKEDVNTAFDLEALGKSPLTLLEVLAVARAQGAIGAVKDKSNRSGALTNYMKDLILESGLDEHEPALVLKNKHRRLRRDYFYNGPR